MEQQTPEWLRFRKSKIGSSDAPVILGLSPWSTPFKLWQEKTGLVEREQITNFAIERGNRWEPAARSRYELKTMCDYPAVVKQHPKYNYLIASLDGYSEEDQVILEIKCLSGRKTFDEALAGRVVPVYYAQIQHQLLVTGAKEAHFFCCMIGKVGVSEAIVEDCLVVVKPDESYQAELIKKEHEFFRMVQEKIQPDLCDRDYLLVSHIEAFRQLRIAKEDLMLTREVVKNEEELLAKVVALKKELKILEKHYTACREVANVEAEKLEHNRIESCGIKLSKSKAGTWLVYLSEEEEK